MSRRSLLQKSVGGLSALALGPSLLAITQPLAAQTDCAAGYGPLSVPDSNGVALPQGFRSRIIAYSGAQVRTSLLRSPSYQWHLYPDGGATFPTAEGGWIYVSNSEAPSFLGGGASAVRFSSDGEIQDAYRVLGDTNRNCAGGPTPWGTWLSCEEISSGRVWECDVTRNTATRRDALGFFKHEAVAVDSLFGHLYLTEDEPDGRLYRFVPRDFAPESRPDLNDGELQVAVVDEPSGFVYWRPLPDPTPSILGTPTRYQVAEATVFQGGEGCWSHQSHVYFTTKGDNRVWQLDTATQFLGIVYDAATSPNPMLEGVDNITVAEDGRVLVAEDGGNMQIVAIDAVGHTVPILQIPDQRDSEITGPAFSPDGTRLYFSSQRGNPFGNSRGIGITYEVQGPFRTCLAL
jgi:secreted PhoX family phosphatase